MIPIGGNSLTVWASSNGRDAPKPIIERAGQLGNIPHDPCTHLYGLFRALIVSLLAYGEPVPGWDLVNCSVVMLISIPTIQINY